MGIGLPPVRHVVAPEAGAGVVTGPTREQALAQVGRMLSASLARHRGGTWRSVGPDARSELGATTRELDGRPDRQDVDAAGQGAVAGANHDRLHDAA